ncbi:hypothetical protein ACP4OV_022300 [Aristida adscensionis]
MPLQRCIHGCRIADNYFINCGSSVDTPVGRRVFVADDSGSVALTAPHNAAVKASSPDAISGLGNAAVYQTARVFTAPSSYSFKIGRRGRHFLRLHFLAFACRSYDLASFKVSTQEAVLIDGFAPAKDDAASPVRDEFLLDVARDTLVSSRSRRSPGASPSTSGSPGQRQHSPAVLPPLQTAYRVNVGGPAVAATGDVLRREWTTDQRCLIGTAGTREAAYGGSLNYLAGEAPRAAAPDAVYATARELTTYLVRFHLCDVVSRAPQQLHVGVYVDSHTVARDLDLPVVGDDGALAVPFYKDFVLRPGDPSGKITVYVGSSSAMNSSSTSPGAILNGIEIMKVHLSSGSVVVVEPTAGSRKQRRLAVVLGSSVEPSPSFDAMDSAPEASQPSQHKIGRRRRRSTTTQLRHGHEERRSKRHGCRFRPELPLLAGKVADLGLSRAGPEPEETHVSTAVRGSSGYVDPEYARTRRLTASSDVYSFGVVLLEALCGRAAVDPRPAASLVECGLHWYARGELEKIVDRRIAGEVKPVALRKYGETVARCLAERGADRPAMEDVVWSLRFVKRLQEVHALDESDVNSMDMVYEPAPSSCLLVREVRRKVKPARRETMRRTANTPTRLCEVSSGRWSMCGGGDSDTFQVTRTLGSES